MFKRLLPLACLGFSACGMMPGMNSGDGSGTASTDAPSSGSQTATTVVASTANAAAAVATAASNPTDANVVNASNAVAGAAASTATASAPGSKSVTFDATRKLEYVDVYVDMGDVNGQRALVPYLMNPKDWNLVGCDMTSLSAK
ncbi:MAG TPA: hypothetical protein VE981_04695, partial [Planctomycetota bacterium]|nr:hypothetical protein [Planctomycetota bacterium]